MILSQRMINEQRRRSFSQTVDYGKRGIRPPTYNNKPYERVRNIVSKKLIL
jgi:hypothetical protein